MLHMYRGDSENGANEHHDGEEERGRSKLSPGLQIPKNRSTGNLAVIGDSSERARIRFSFDAGAAAAEYDSLTRSPLMTDHDHGLGLSGLRRIRQHNPVRNPTLPSPSNPSSRSPSISLPRSASMTMMWQHGKGTSGLSLSPGPASPSFTEDLSRFPSESLHSFSFASQSDELLHSRQNALKRSLEFMKDRMGWAQPNSNNIAMATAQARATGDIDGLNALELLAQARVAGAGGAGGMPNPDPSALQGPLTGPADVSGANLFDKQFIPRTTSPEPLVSPVSPVTSRRQPSPEKYAKDVTGTGQDAAGSVGASQGKSEAQREHAGKGSGADTDGDGADGTGAGAAASESPDSSRTPTNESGTTAQTAQTAHTDQTSPPQSRRPSSLKRTLTDTAHASMQQKLMDALAQPYVVPQTHAGEPVLSPTSAQSFASSLGPIGSAVHGHATRWVPAAQAIFTTEAKPPWTILAANDLACLVFGVTKAEVRKMGILEVVQEERRSWLENKLKGVDPDEAGDGSESEAQQSTASTPRAVSSSLLGSRGGGITALLLSKPNSRSQAKKAQSLQPPAQDRKAQTIHGGDTRPSKPANRHGTNKSRGVLLCGDVVPIQKRNGATGSASLWVKEKRVGLIWVLEEIHEDVATVALDDDGLVTRLEGSLGPIWGDEGMQPGLDIGRLIPRIPRQGIDPRFGPIDYAQVNKRRYFTCRNCDRVNIPATVEQIRGKPELRVSSFPHIAGIVVVCPKTLKIKSSNSVFCGALFGYEKPDGRPIRDLVPDFDKILGIVTDEDGIELTDAIVVPEHSFRKASAFLALREGRPDAAMSFLRPEGLPARHRDGSELKIDVQMRVVKSEKKSAAVIHEDAVLEASEDESSSGAATTPAATQSELVYALWITYSRHLHASRNNLGAASPLLSGAATPLHQPSPGQTPAHTPQEISSDTDEPKKEEMTISKITKQIKDVARGAAAKIAGVPKAVVGKNASPGPGAGPGASPPAPVPGLKDPPEPAAGADSKNLKAAAPPPPSHRKTLDDFVILEEMGQGAYGQVKLARYRDSGRRVVLKYVTKRRILVDTWTRDRRLGTVPLEIHVLDYLRRDGFRHPNIVEMEDFFEDDVNYYIEMPPHGLPGMDLFDYIELRTNMDEDECRSIFVQVARAIHHLHTVAHVVHRDIKDENVILDGEGNIKLIDFGSAAYIKSGPYDVFVGTIDYAAPEVLGGQPYGGKEQDVWALGILLYTIIYKENPFYSIDEIMDRDLRVPYTISDESIDLIRRMLNRDVKQRYSISQVLDHPWCADAVAPAGAAAVAGIGAGTVADPVAA